MTPRAWLTPDAPPGEVVCYSVYAPQGEEWEAALRGALFGSVTPDEAAQAFVDAAFETMKWRPCLYIGTVFSYAGTDTPDHCLECQGQQVAADEYPLLYAVVGSTFGSADPGYFRLPDLAGRAVIGEGSGSGLTPRSLADQGGEETHTLSESEMPVHTHSDNAAVASIVNGGVEAPAAVATPTIMTTGPAGAGLPHENMPPFITLRALIYAG